jgi:hypothetical protein
VFLVPVEAQTARSHFDAFAGLFVCGDMEVDVLKGDVAEFAKVGAPSGIGIGVGATDAVVEVDGFEGDLGLMQREEKRAAVGAARKAHAERGRAVAEVDHQPTRRARTRV